MKLPISLLTLSLATGLTGWAQTTKQAVFDQIDASQSTYGDIALKIWSYAEVGYQETKSSGLLQSQLESEGFKVEADIGGMPTAFVASYGSGHPIIGVLAEFDALPGVAQAAVPERSPIEGQIAGHACGHHLFGTASVEAAVSVKNWLKATGQKGTIRVYGCPAEEGGSGKVYVVRSGVLDDVDAVLHWHPGDGNGVTMSSTLANKSGKFRFYGVASHAAAAPERGRSALDAVEAMDHMVNMMREHVPDSTRIHYVITRGGEAPNVVPAFAEVYYYVRSPDRAIVMSVWDRVQKAADGAALGTGTTTKTEITGGAYDLLPNETLGRIMQTNLEAVGGVTYDAKETAWAEELQKTLPAGRKPTLNQASKIYPFDPTPHVGSASTDVGDVSWAVPTIGLGAATWVPGTPAHSWQAVAAGGTSIGVKGMQVAAKTIAGTAMDLFQSPDALKAAKTEFEQRRGSDFHYEAMVGDREPPLDYRN